MLTRCHFKERAISDNMTKEGVRLNFNDDLSQILKIVKVFYDFFAIRDCMDSQAIGK